MRKLTSEECSKRLIKEYNKDSDDLDEFYTDKETNNYYSFLYERKGYFRELRINKETKKISLITNQI